MQTVTLPEPVAKLAELFGTCDPRVWAAIRVGIASRSKPKTDAGLALRALLTRQGLIYEEDDDWDGPTAEGKIATRFIGEFEFDLSEESDVSFVMPDGSPVAKPCEDDEW